MHMTKKHEILLVAGLTALICSGAFALVAGNHSEQPKVATDKPIVNLTNGKRTRYNPL